MVKKTFICAAFKSQIRAQTALKVKLIINLMSPNNIRNTITQ